MIPIESSMAVSVAAADGARKPVVPPESSRPAKSSPLPRSGAPCGLPEHPLLWQFGKPNPDALHAFPAQLHSHDIETPVRPAPQGLVDRRPSHHPGGRGGELPTHKERDPRRARAAAERVRPPLTRDLEAVGLKFGGPVFLRIFKEERQLELWVQVPGRRTFKLFRTYRIAAGAGQKYEEEPRDPFLFDLVNV